MPTTDVEKLVVSMSADFKSYERALAKVQGTTVRELRKLERQAQTSMTRVENIFSRFGKGLIAGLGVGGIAEIGRAIQQAVSQAAKIGDLSDKIGLSTDALQALQLGAAQADLSFEGLNTTLLRFSKTLGEAANGQGEYLKTLRANDQQLKGSFFENLGQLADLVKNAKNEQEALLIITQAMGKGSDEWLEVLKKGSAGIRQLGEEARNTGAIVEESLIKEAQRLDDKWASLMNQMGTYTKTFAVEAAKALGEIFGNAQKLSDSLRAGNARQFFFGNQGGLSGAIGNALFGPDQTLAPEDPAMRQPRGTRENIFARPVKPTKVFNPETAAAEKRAREEATRAAERQAQAIADVIEELEFEQQQLQASELTQEINNELRKAGVTLLSEEEKKRGEIPDPPSPRRARRRRRMGDRGEGFHEVGREVREGRCHNGTGIATCNPETQRGMREAGFGSRLFHRSACQHLRDRSHQDDRRQKGRGGVCGYRAACHGPVRAEGEGELRRLK